MYFRPMAASLVTFCAMHGAEPVKATDAKIGGAPSAEAAQAPFPPCPPQDQGLPYTRSAHDRALAHLQDHVAVFAGSRIAWVYGKRVTLDDREPRRWAAVRQGGTILVPARFAGLLTVEHPSARSQPLPYLADRWVWDLERPALPAGVPIVDHEGQPYVNLAALAKSLGLQVVSDPRGLEVVGRKAAVLPERTTPQFDALITLFDSPEQFADPAIPPAWIPALIRQGTWDSHVKMTPQQRALLEGPETRWTMTPATADDLTGFNAALLGSAVPAPSVYPRLLFSPQDVPAVAARIRATRSGQAGLIEIEELFKKSWWDPTTDDGKIFVKLSHGVTEGLEFQAPKPSRSWEPQPPLWNPQHLFVGQKPGIHNTHIWYVPQCLTTMALWCLLEGDDVRGQQVATAIATYYRLRESFIDQQYAISDSEFGSDAGSNGDGRTHWRRSFHPAQHMDLAFALDFGGKWMTEDQKSDLQRIIAKLT